MNHAMHDELQVYNERYMVPMDCERYWVQASFSADEVYHRWPENANFIVYTNIPRQSAWRRKADDNPLTMPSLGSVVPNHEGLNSSVLVFGWLGSYSRSVAEVVSIVKSQ